jgi:hypothetical protein
MDDKLKRKLLSFFLVLLFLVVVGLLVVYLLKKHNDNKNTPGPKPSPHNDNKNTPGPKPSPHNDNKNTPGPKPSPHNDNKNTPGPKPSPNNDNKNTPGPKPYPCTNLSELSDKVFPVQHKAYCRTGPHQNFNTRGMNASDLRGCIGKELESTWYYKASRANINSDTETATINEASKHSPGHTLTVPARDDNFSTSIDCIYDETACRKDVKAALKAGMEKTYSLLHSKPLFQAYHWGGYGSVPMSHLHTVTSKYDSRLSGPSPMVDGIQCEGNHNIPANLRNKVNRNGVCVFIDMDSDGIYKNLDSNADFICKNRYDPIKN